MVVVVVFMVLVLVLVLCGQKDTASATREWAARSKVN